LRILSESAHSPRTPMARKLWQNTSYSQIGGMNNWFYNSSIFKI